jgi:hypothetical protein
MGEATNESETCAQCVKLCGYENLELFEGKWTCKSCVESNLDYDEFMDYLHGPAWRKMRKIEGA